MMNSGGDARQKFIFESIVVNPGDYMDAIEESFRLSKIGIMRLVCLPGQETEALGWSSARCLEDALAKVLAPH